MARKPEVVVAGLGVAGSTLAYLAAYRGFEVEGYDVARRYLKACGDAVTVRPLTLRLVNETDSLLTGVRRFMIAVNGRVIHEFGYRGDVWVVVDKSRLVNTLRELAIAEGARFVWRKWKGERGHVTVDARGPYGGVPGRAVMLYRAIARGEWPSDTALLDFNVRERGVYWIIPADDSGSKVNVGAGFEQAIDPGTVKQRILSYSEKMTGSKITPVDWRGAPLKLFRPVKLYSGGLFMVGEAGGFLLRTGGEGNRLGMLTAQALVEAMTRSGLSERRLKVHYRSLTKSFRNEVETSRFLLSIVARAPSRLGEEILLSLPRFFWRRFVEARVYAGTALAVMLSRPSLAVKAIRSLLSSPS